MNKILNLFIYYLLLFLGLGITSWMIWSRFIRERTIRDIPDLLLTEYRFWILLYICIIYLYVIKNLIKPKTNNPFSNIINILYKPLTVLDNFIKYNKYIRVYYYKSMIYFIKHLDFEELDNGRWGACCQLFIIHQREVGLTLDRKYGKYGYLSQ